VSTEKISVENIIIPVMINLLNSGYPSIWRNVYFKLMFKSGNLFFTIVAACNNALTGVGAFIAGSQACKPN
jgi:hypothetical protein